MPMKDLANLVCDQWLVLADFNLINQDADKTNTNLNRRLVGSFKVTLDVIKGD